MSETPGNPKIRFQCIFLLDDASYMYLISFFLYFSRLLAQSKCQMWPVLKFKFARQGSFQGPGSVLRRGLRLRREDSKEEFETRPKKEEETDRLSNMPAKEESIRSDATFKERWLHWKSEHLRYVVPVSHSKDKRIKMNRWRNNCDGSKLQQTVPVKKC